MPRSYSPRDRSDFSHDATRVLQWVAALQAAEQSNRQNTRLLAAASHELRLLLQRLSALDGAMSRPVSESELAERLSQQEQTIDAMSRVLVALLGICNPGSRAIEPAQVDFRPAGVRDELRNELTSLADPQGLPLRQTPRGRVTVHYVYEPGRVRLRVLDTGVDIWAVALPRLLDGFSRRETHSMQHKAAGRRQGPDAHTPRVLLVEQDRAVRDATRMLLTTEGYEVALAGSLSEALVQAARQPGIQLLITGHHLGNNETGLQVITAVRQRMACELRAILVTCDTSAAMRASRRDARLHVANKPIDADTFLPLVSELTAR